MKHSIGKLLEGFGLDSHHVDSLAVRSLFRTDRHVIENKSVDKGHCHCFDELKVVTQQHLFVDKVGNISRVCL